MVILGRRAWREKTCRKCKFISACGDIFPETGKCTANTGGETWAKFTKKETKHVS